MIRISDSKCCGDATAVIIALVLIADAADSVVIRDGRDGGAAVGVSFRPVDLIDHPA